MQVRVHIYGHSYTYAQLHVCRPMVNWNYFTRPLRGYVGLATFVFMLNDWLLIANCRRQPAGLVAASA